MPKTERWRPLEIDEVALLFDNANNDNLIRYMMLLIGCSSRPTAAIEVCGSRIDTEAGTIDLLITGEAQTNKYRPTVRLPSFIEAIYHEQNLVSQGENVPNLNNLRNRQWMPMRDRAGLDDLVVPSSIRHTMARWLRSQGVEPWHASSQLGHKRKGNEITEIYAPNDPTYLEEALAAVEEYFAKVYEKSVVLQQFEGLKNYSPRCGLVAISEGGKQ
jgi:integrase